MKKIKLIYLKNQMLVANSIANFIGVLLVNTLMLRIQETFAREILEYPILLFSSQPVKCGVGKLK